MKYLVTGGAGFIGSNLIRCLLKDNTHQVLNVDKLTYAGNPESLTDVNSSPGYSFRKIDIVDSSAVSEVVEQFQPDGIFHLAAESHVDRSIDAPSPFIQTNVVGTFNLLQAARHLYESKPDNAKQHFRFLHVSTDEVFGSLSSAEGGFTEESPYHPHSPYSASKASSDHLVRAWANTWGLPVLITNCSNNYGPFQLPEKLIPVVILNAMHGKPIPVYGDGQHRRDWLYVQDHVEALIQVMQNGIPGHTYNVAAGNEQQNINLVRSICLILDEILPIANNLRLSDETRNRIQRYEELICFVSDRPGHDRRYAMDCSKIQSELGWHAKEKPTGALQKTVAWYLDNESWWNEFFRNGRFSIRRLETK